MDLIKEISAKEYRDTAKTDVLLWLVKNVRRFSQAARVPLDARPNSGKQHRQHRPCLTVGMTNTGEFRTLFLTSGMRRFSVSVSPCNARCQNFHFFQRSYIFEWRRGYLVLLPGELFSDESTIRFCGKCPKAVEIPQDVLHDCFVP